MRPTLSLLLLAAAPGFAAQVERSLPLFFFANNGQTSPSIRYVAETPDLRAGFRSDGIAFQIQHLNIGLRFAGANPEVSMEASEPMPGKINFFQGDRAEDWKRDIPAYHRILYRGLYPGIDAVYGGAGRWIKSEFVVAPGADASLIRLEYSGIDGISIDSGGALVIREARTELREEAPVIYQDTAQGRTAISGRYRMLGEHTVGFEIDSYDVSRALVIDPILSYSTYLGGSSMGAVTGVAADVSGNLYVTGWTEALDFPIAGAVQAANQGGVDAFIVKLNPAGSSILYATYIGGRGDDRGAAIAVDSSGQAYVTGATASTNFPLANALQPRMGGSRTAFVLKLNPIGNMLVYSTYLGGTNYELGNAIAVDASGNAYVAGDTQSANFPLAGGFQGTLGGGMDAFVAKLTPAGGIGFSSYLGGSSNEHAGGIAVDSSGNVYVAGGTASGNFPITGAIQSISGGGQDAFVTKINSSGSSIVYSTYLGGSRAPGTQEQANGIAVDAAGNAYIAGITSSTNFPVTVGTYQTAFGGVQDGFVSKINPAGSALVYSTYLGGFSSDWASGIAVDAGGNAYITGFTASSNFASIGAVQAVYRGLQDGFVSKLNPAGNALMFSTFFGGTGSDAANAIALDPNANIFIGGQTNSLDLPLQGPIQFSNAGGAIGWVARLGVTAPPASVPGASSVTPSSGSGNTATFTAQYSDSTGAANLTSVALLVNTSASTNFACYVTYNPAAQQFMLGADMASSGSITVLPGGGTGQNSQCTLNGAGSSAALSGNTLTLTVSLTFDPSFGGSKTVYLSAADTGSNTGWISRGAWTVTVPPPHPTADSVSPNGGSGASQTFTFVFSDTQNAVNLTGLAVLFSNSVSFPNACYLVYDTFRGTMALLWDSALGSDSKPIGSTTVLQNSQCALGTSSIRTSGLSEILTLSITFKGAFSGVKNIFMYGSEGSLNTGWVQNGTFNVSAGGVPVASSVVPGSGSGPSQRFSFTISDQGGASYLTGMAILIASSFNTTNACSLVYDRTVNRVSLGYDNPANGASPLVPGSSTVVSNSQCTLRGTNTTLVIGTTSIVLTLDLSFNAAWFGAKNVYLYAAEPTANSGWVQIGSWTVTGGAPTADSVAPASGSGSSGSFTFSATDSSAGSNITGMSMLFTTGAPTNTAGSCNLVYNRSTATIGLYADNGTTLNTKGIGSSATLENSECAVGYTVMSTSGNSVLFTINLVFFSPAFSGSKAVYLQANEPATNSGFVARGSWTVP